MKHYSVVYFIRNHYKYYKCVAKSKWEARRMCMRDVGVKPADIVEVNEIVSEEG